MAWKWEDHKRAIGDCKNNFPGYLMLLPREEIEHLIWSNDHWCNVVGHFAGTNGDRAREVYDEIKRRARDGHS